MSNVNRSSHFSGQHPRLFPLLFSFLILFSSIVPSVKATSSVTDSFTDMSRIATISQLIVLNGSIHVDVLPLADYGSVRKIVVNSTDILETLTNFPVLVYLNSSRINWNNVQDDLDDLRFTVDNVTLLSYEIDTFVVNDEAWIWVKLPFVSNISDTEFFMYYNNPSASSYWNPESVWDSNYVFVSHMNDDPDTSHIRDSTSNDNDGTKKAVNEPIATTSGEIGDAQDFNAINTEYITIPHHSSLDFGVADWGLSFWANVSTLRDALGSYYGANTWGLSFRSNTELHFFSVTAALAVNSIIIDVPAYLGSLTKFDIIINRTDNKLYVYHNGAFISASAVVAQSFTSTNGINIADFFTAQDQYGFSGGVFDELRLFTNARSASWVLASYESERDHLLAYGAEDNGNDEGYFVSTNMLSGLNVSQITGFSYNCSKESSANITFRFTQDKLKWYNSTDIDGWEPASNGSHYLNLIPLGWSSGMFYYQTNITDGTLPLLYDVSVHYVPVETTAETVQAIFGELFYGSGAWFGLLILLALIVVLSLANKYLGVLMMPVTIYLGINYLGYPSLMWQGLIMFLAGIFVLVNLVRSQD